MLRGPRDSLCLGWSWGPVITNKHSEHGAASPERGLGPRRTPALQSPHVSGGLRPWGSPCQGLLRARRSCDLLLP